MVKSKTTCLEWHFGEVGHGSKKNIWGFFLPKFLVKMAMISYSDSKFKSSLLKMSELFLDINCINIFIIKLLI
jgi:hypothetical protein